MPKFNLRKIQNHLALAPDNRVRIDDDTYFRNTYYSSDGNEDLGTDIEFIHEGIVLRRFPDDDIDETNSRNNNKHAGFTFVDNAHGRRKLRQAIIAYDVLDKVLANLRDEGINPSEININDLEV